MTTRMTTTSTPRNALAQARTPIGFRVTGGVRPYAEHPGVLTGLCPPDLAYFLSKNAPIRSTRGNVTPLIPSDPQPMPL